jgi:hypothetical protein
MTKQSSSVPALAFRETTFHPVAREGQQWLPAAEIAQALGYANDNAISRIYARHKDEFTGSMTERVKVTLSGNLDTEARIFSLRGAHLLGMFARTERATEFRRWVLDILDREAAAPRPEFDVRARVLANPYTPTAPIPPEVHSAINRKAWALAGSAYELIREAITRRVAYMCELGQPRSLDPVRAQAVLAETTLDMALEPTYYENLQGLCLALESVERLAQRHREEVRAVLAAGRST